MLVLSRKSDETVIINGNITVTVVAIEKGRVKLGFVAPPEVPIMRSELMGKPGETSPGESE